MALTEKLTAIADAIRGKYASSRQMYLSQMPEKIAAIPSCYDDIPAEIFREAERVAAQALGRGGENVLRIVAVSDLHEMGDGEAEQALLEQYRRANRNAGQGAKVVADLTDAEVFVCLGDLVWGSAESTLPEGVQGIANAREYLQDVMKGRISILTPGNHDFLSYSYDANGEMLPQAVIDGLIGTYRYVDISEKKVRLICLNTADMQGTSVTASVGAERIGAQQLQWFAQALDLSDKEDAGQWSILILAHHPLDWGNVKEAANVLAAYLAGESYTAQVEDDTVSYDFSGKNAAAVIGQLHGHVHGFRVDAIHSFDGEDVAVTTAKRIAIPNACFGRNNEYGENSGADSNGIEFGESASWEKTDDGTAQNTAFCLITLDLDARTVYADCFGRGYDRVIPYGDNAVITYSITNQLSNAVSSNASAVVVAGGTYEALITPDDGMVLAAVQVTMGGVDISDTAVSDGGKISIGCVTGDVVITATAESGVAYAVSYTLHGVSCSNCPISVAEGDGFAAQLSAGEGQSVGYVRIKMGGVDITADVYDNGAIEIEQVSGALQICAGYYTNLVELAQTADGSGDLFNGSGYIDDYRISGGVGTSAAAGYVTTGVMDYPTSEGVAGTVYIRGAVLDTTDGYCRFSTVYRSSDGTFKAMNQILGGQADGSTNAFSSYFTVTQLASRYYKLVHTGTTFYESVQYMMLSLIGSGEDLIVTVDEPIE